MRFSQYHFVDEIKNNLEKLGYKKPTDIQFKCIPNILKGEDVLAIAQTGTGKTAAFVLPILHILHAKNNSRRARGIQCVVMVPTRELAKQTWETFTKLGKNTRVDSFALYGGVEQLPQIEKLEDGLDVLISTPGRLFDLVSQGYLQLHQVDILVLDEADHMLAKGFIKDIRDLVRLLPKKRQTLFFSATIDDEIKDLAYSLVVNPIRIQVSPKDPVSKNVDHYLMYVEMDDKRFFLERLVKEYEGKKILVFVRTQVRAERVVKAMERVSIHALALHGGKEQKERFEVLQKFKEGSCHLLIATDVSSRGIDIQDVHVVLNYDIPDIVENYVHRVGRTGRGMSKGIAFSFCTEEEKDVLGKIVSYLGYQPKEMEIHNDNYQEVTLFSNEKKMELKDVLTEFPYLQKGKKKKS
ncbi:MAG: DEAD/DEAH box helicase [Saprospiraceae bacterium]